MVAHKAAFEINPRLAYHAQHAHFAVGTPTARQCFAVTHLGALDAGDDDIGEVAVCVGPQQQALPHGDGAGHRCPRHHRADALHLEGVVHLMQSRKRIIACQIVLGQAAVQD